VNLLFREDDGKKKERIDGRFRRTTSLVVRRIAKDNFSSKQVGGKVCVGIVFG